MARMIVEVLADTSRYEKGLKNASRETKGFARSVGQLRVGFASLAKATVVVEAVDKAIEGLTESVHAGIEEASQRAKVDAQVTAAIAAQGAAATVSSSHVDELALSLSNLTGIDDEIIKAGEATLVTFGNIQNFAGKGNDIFDRATRAAVDFAARTGRSVRTASIAIGRALADPAKAATALRRAQVVLAADERKGIEAALKHGDVLKAQGAVLAALEKRYKGAGEALGRTFPGQLAILRERFRDLAGTIVESVFPSLEGVVGRLTNFVRKLSETKGIRAKLKITWEGIEDVSVDLGEAIVSAGDRIGAYTAQLAVKIGNNLRDVDWPAAIEQAAHAVGDALVTAFNALTSVIDSVNWQRVGQVMARGFALAIAGVLHFLASVDWGAVVKSMLRFFFAAWKAQQLVFLGIGEEIGRWILDGLRRAAVPLERLAVRIVLAIVAPFTHLPGFLGEPFRKIKENFQATLADMQAQAATGGKAIADTLNASIDAAIKAGKELPGGGEGGGTGKPKVKDLGKPPPIVIPDATIAEQARKREERARQIIDALSFGVEQAEATKTVRDDIAALKRLEAGIREQMRIVGRTLDLRRQLFQTIQAIADKRREAEQQAQFRALGLTAEGDERGPGVRALRRRLERLRDITPDTAKMRSFFAGVARTLAGGFGKVTQDTLAKIDEMFDAIEDKFNSRVDFKSLKRFSTKRLIEAMGLTDLTAEQTRKLRGGLAAISPNMTVPARPSQAFALAGGGGVTVMGDVHVHGVTDVASLENKITKRAAARPHTRRGAR